MNPLPTVDALADRFAELMFSLLDGRDTLLMMQRNAENAAKGDNCCASHDFCDANVVMCDALKELAGESVNVNADDVVALWNDAWDIAKRRYFTARPATEGRAVIRWNCGEVNVIAFDAKDRQGVIDVLDIALPDNDNGMYELDPAEVPEPDGPYAAMLKMLEAIVAVTEEVDVDHVFGVKLERIKAVVAKAKGGAA